MSDGFGCQCTARSASECCCDVDWRSSREVELEAEIIALKAELVEAKKDAELLKHCEMACKHLPEGWEIKICLERWAGSVDLYDPEGNEVSFDCDHERLETMVKNSIDQALKGKR